MRIGENSLNRGTPTVTPTTTSATSVNETSASDETPSPKSVESTSRTELKKGDVIEGKVVSKETDGSAVIKTQDGKELRLKVLGSDEAVTQGKNIRIQLEDVSGSVKTGRLLETPQTPSVATDSKVDSLLKSFGETTGETQRSVIKAMMEFDIPLTKENFKAIQNDSKYAQKLAEVLSRNPDLGKTVDITSEIKNILVRLLAVSVNKQVADANVPGQNQEQGVDEAQLADPTDVTDTKGSVGKKDLGVASQNGMLQDGKTAKETLTATGSSDGSKSTATTATATGTTAATASAASTATVSVLTGSNNEVSTSKQPPFEITANQTQKTDGAVLEQLLPDENLAVTQGKSTPSSEVEGSKSEKAEMPKLQEHEMMLMDQNSKTVKTEILQSLKEHSADKTAFFKKMSIDSTLSNIMTFNRLLINKQSMIGSFEKIFAGMKATGMTQDADVQQLLMKLSGLDNTDIDGHIDVLKQLATKVSALKESQSSPYEKVSDQLTQLRQDFDFIKNISENLVYYQMPLRYEDGTGQLEIAYKKRKKDPSEGHKIFISLDTKNIGQVQAMVEMKAKHVKINFRVEDDSLRKRFEASFEDLKQAISVTLDVDEEQGHTIDIGFIVRQEPLSAMELFKSEVPALSAFDMSI